MYVVHTSRRCDDLESLGYVIISLLRKGRSNLPWSGSTSIEDGLDTKSKTSLDTLCQESSAGMLGYMETVRCMAYDEDPDYEKLDSMLQSMASSKRVMPAGVENSADACEHPPKRRCSSRLSSKAKA